MRRSSRALVSGLAGAVLTNVLNESVRRLAPARAPRLDLLGTRGLARLFRLAGQRPPAPKPRFALALAGDLVANALTFALVEPGTAPNRVGRGALLGTASGLGAVVLPPRLGLGSAPTRRTGTTKALSMAWYLAGGLAAGLVARRLARA